MKTKVLNRVLFHLGVVCAFLLLSFPLFAGEFSVRVTFSPDDLTFERLFGCDLVTLDGCGLADEVGKPRLPTQITYVALPGKVTASGVEVVSLSWEELPGAYDILLTSEPLPVGPPPQDSSLLQQYNFFSGTLYPEKAVDFLYPSDLGGVALACLAIHPLRYDPRDGKLFLHTEIEFSIRFQEEWNSQEPDRTNNPNFIDAFESIIKEMVLNPEHVRLGAPGSGVTPLGGMSSQYEHVIISPDSYATYYEPLKDWYTQKGMPSTIVTQSWINSNYSGSNEQARIRNFIIDASSSWGTLFFLLGGSPSSIPYDWSTYYGDNIPNDTYYSDYDDDWVCEVFVGRASVTSTSQVSTFVNKVLAYETSPPAGNYGKKVGLFGFDLDSSTQGEKTMEYIRLNYLPPESIPCTVYDSHTGNHEVNVKDTLNQGVSLVAHSDHANYSVLGVGYVRHGMVLDLGEMNSFTNGDRLTTFYSLGCWSAAMDYYNIGDAFVRNPNGGGIAYVGNTRYGWYYVGDFQSLSARFMLNFYKVLYLQDAQSLGKLFAKHKNQTPPGGAEIMKYIWTELVLFGEPGLTLWTDTPVASDAKYPQVIYREPQDFKVLITRNGKPVSGRVCLQKSDEGLYAYGTAGLGGFASIAISPSSNGIMDILITGKNCLPNPTTCQIIDPTTDPPILAGISPDQGTEVGGTEVTLWGDNFHADTTVQFGSSLSGKVVPVTPSLIVCITPPGPIGTVDVTVTTPYGSDTLEDAFTYTPYPPAVSSVEPDNGCFNVYTPVTIHGQYFTTTEDTTVSFGGNPASDISVIDRNTLTCLAPPQESEGYVDVTVTHSGGSGTLPDGFRYNFPPPEVTSITPNYGTIYGGTEVTVTGNYFTQYTVAFINYFGAETEVLDQHTLVFKTFAHGPGSVTIFIANLTGYAEIPNGFTFIDRPICYCLSESLAPGGNGVFKIVAPDRPGQGIILCASDTPGYSYFGPPYDFALDMERSSIRVLYESILDGGKPKLDAKGELTVTVKVPSGYSPGTTARFQAVAGTISPIDLESSNYVDVLLE